MGSHGSSERKFEAIGSSRTFVAAGALLVLAALGIAGSGVGAASRPDMATLRGVSARLDGALSTVRIEATEPVAYETSRPNPLTVLVDLRNVDADNLAAAGGLDPLAPVRSVNLERAVSADGVPVARVRVELEHEATHRVRSARNLIFVEVDRAAPKAVSPARIATTRPVAASNATTGRAASATSLKSVRALAPSEGSGIAIVGNGRLEASSVEEAKDLPPRVLLDFRDVSTGSAPAVTAVGGDIRRVRVAVNSREPLVTRVVIDLTKKMPYRIASAGAEGEEVRILFGDGQASVAAAPEPATSEASADAVPSVTLAQTVADVQVPVTAPVAAPLASPAPAMAQPVATLMTAQAAPAPAAPAATLSIQGSRTPDQPRFTGPPVTLDFQGADLRAVLRTFSEISGLNVVIDPSITGSVDVSLRDVPWDQALDIILKANKLGYSVDGTIVRIAPIAVLAEEEAERRKLTEAQALSGELRVLTRPLSYAKAQDLVPIVTRSALSSRGEVQVDSRTNTLIIRDLADRLQGAADIVTALDRPQPQVEIEARIIQTSRDFARALGVQWGFTGRAEAALGNTSPLAFPNSGSLTGRMGATQGPGGADSAVNLPVAGASTALGLALGSINGALNLDVALTALERQGKGRVLSTPRVSTQNNVEAEITQGVQIPIQTVANNTVTVQFKDAALTLRVTPQITASNTVIMRISLENASPDFSRAVNGIPPIDTQRALTSVLVGDGETTVIGGIFVSREQTNEDKVPYLNRLPLLGWLFRRDSVGDESRELLIFITPRITRS